MVVSARLRLGGFYSEVARRVASAPGGPARLLAGVIAVAATLSAVLANDVGCCSHSPPPWRGTCCWSAASPI